MTTPPAHPDPASPACSLSVLYGPDTGRTFPLDAPRMDIGRGKTCSIVLADREISRRHAALSLGTDGWTVRDMGSTNGIRINGEQKGEHLLRHGDVVTAGHTAMMFKVHPPSSSEPEADEPDAHGLSHTILMNMDQAFLDWSAERDPEHLLRVSSDLEAVYTVGQTLHRILDTERLVPSILDILLRYIPRVDRVAIHMLDPDTGDLTKKASRDRSGEDVDGPVLSRTVADRVIESRRAVLTHDALTDDRFRDGRSIIAQRIRSAACAPIQSMDRILGVIYADTLEKNKLITPADLRLLTAIGRQAGAAFANARLYEQLKREKEELDRAHENLRAAQDRLIQQEKLAGLGKLAAGIVHDIKNPIGVSAEYSRFIQDELKEHAPELADRLGLDGHFHYLDEGLKHALDVIERLMTFAKPSQPRRAGTDVNELVREALSMVRHEATKASLRLHTNLRDDIPAVELDATQIKQVVINILLNAIQAMDKPEPVLTIETNLVDENDRRYVVARFEDNGMGMNEEQKRRVFDPFYTTKSPREGETGGTGLGMSMVQAIVRGHGGRVDIRSEPGAGSSISVWLPATPAEDDA